MGENKIEFFKENFEDGWCEETFFNIQVVSNYGNLMKSHLTFKFTYDEEVIGEADVFLKNGYYSNENLIGFFDSISQADIDSYFTTLKPNKYHMNILTSRRLVFINEFRVKKEYRGMDVGRTLLGDMENFMRTIGFKVVYVNSCGLDEEPAAHDFFIKNGYLPVKKRNLESDCCTMYKFL